MDQVETIKDIQMNKKTKEENITTFNRYLYSNKFEIYIQQLLQFDSQTYFLAKNDPALKKMLQKIKADNKEKSFFNPLNPLGTTELMPDSKGKEDYSFFLETKIALSIDEIANLICGLEEQIENDQSYYTQLAHLELIFSLSAFISNYCRQHIAKQIANLPTTTIEQFKSLAHNADITCKTIYDLLGLLFNTPYSKEKTEQLYEKMTNSIIKLKKIDWNMQKCSFEI